MLWIHWYMIKWALIFLAIGWIVRKAWPTGEWIVTQVKAIVAKFKKTPPVA